MTEPGTDDPDAAPSHLGPEAARAYLDARIQGLCHEGALEIAEALQWKIEGSRGNVLSGAAVDGRRKGPATGD